MFAVTKSFLIRFKNCPFQRRDGGFWSRGRNVLKHRPPEIVEEPHGAQQTARS
jgi:hypothetical protein